MRCHECNKYMMAVILGRDVIAICWQCWIDLKLPPLEKSE